MTDKIQKSLFSPFMSFKNTILNVNASKSLSIVAELPGIMESLQNDTHTQLWMKWL